MHHYDRFRVKNRSSYDAGSWMFEAEDEALVEAADILQGTPRSTLHLPLTGSGGARLTKGGSSKNPTVKWNFSGTPWGGTWLCPGQTMSLMSKPLLSG